MPDWYKEMPDHMMEFIKKQPVFFVASAPLTGKHVNISPKGHTSRTFAVLSPTQVAYVDSSGSGCETISHLYENGRATIMFCSFVKAPRIIRLFCTGRVIERNSPDFRPMLARMRDAGMKIESADKIYHDLVEAEQNGDSGSSNSSEDDEEKVRRRSKGIYPSDTDLNKDDGAGVVGARAIIVFDIWSAQKSCGFGVPLLIPNNSSNESSLDDTDATKTNGLSGEVASEKHFTKTPKSRSANVYDTVSVRFDNDWDDRTTLTNWGAKMVSRGAIQEYRVANNTTSLDGLPGVRMVRRGKAHSFALCSNAWARRTFVGQWPAVLAGALLLLLVQAVAFYSYINLYSSGRLTI